MSIYDWSATLRTHRQCVGDTSRTDLYTEAIAEVIRPGDVVVDVGTGTGILGMMACRAGARTVYAIEPDQIIESARQVCAANGLAEQIIFLPGQDSITICVSATQDNIAEGFDRSGNKEFVRFLTYSKGSAAEVKSQLYRAFDRKYIDQNEFENKCRSNALRSRT